ncbi:MAG TPA: penicillin acylase family protein, partial [Rhodobacterales bacterium]|nr:penicillin acylase family protein [Rhodobacterales bacterium]
MGRLFRWTVRAVTAALLLALFALVFVYYLAARSLPDYSGTHPVRGISAPVEIVRDQADVPHIYGETDADVYFALGYAHAQDRLWQMIMLRRTAQGRLSEVFGERTLQIDDLMRRLDIYALAQEAVAVQDQPTREALTAYAHGVNAWLDRVNAESLGRGAPELFLFSNEIAPWVPADSLAVLKLMAVQMGSHIQSEVLRARVALAIGPERLADILPDAPGTGVAALPEYAALFNASPRDFAALAPLPATDPLSPIAPTGMGGASNAWAAAPSRSAAGGTLLANDPHLGFTAPTIWYLAHLELASGGVIGGTIPGMPVVLVGRSDAFGWGLTSSYMDDQDVFIERLNPDDPGEVLTPDGYKPLQTRASIIRVKDQPPVTIELRWSENGPVLPGNHYGLAAVTPKGHVAAIGWTMLTAQDRSMTSALHLMQSKSVAEGLRAGAAFLAPSQNITMIDANSIALKTVGAMPRRTAGHMTQGRLPAPGWEAANRWLGFEAYAANPEF